MGLAGMRGRLLFPDMNCYGMLLLVRRGAWGEEGGSLWQVVETHRDTDVARETDVNAEVNQSLFRWACRERERDRGGTITKLVF